MDYTFNELKHKTVAEMREIASQIDNEAVKGYTQLNKDHLLEAICKALNIDMYVHHKVVGVNKKKIKSKIQELKKARDVALASGDHQKLMHVRSQIKSQKRKIRSAMV